METFSRSKLILGNNNIELLKNKHVAVFGLGGVGSYVVETLVRTGISNFTLIDHDTISYSNINRQLFALHSTINKYKVDVAKERILDINPDATITVYKTFILQDTINSLNFNNFDYIIDAVDTITAKLLIIEKAKIFDIPIISSMGTGNKLDPYQFKISDISKTSVCPLARVMRYELKKRNIKNVKVLFSTEQPLDINKNYTKNDLLEISQSNKHQIPGSVAFVPSIAGILIAREVILDLIKN